MSALACHMKTAFCLTAEVEKDEQSRSGFRCAELQLTTGKPLYGRVRFAGIAAMTRLGFADHTVIIGGQENRYPDEHIGRAEAFRDLLQKDFKAEGQIAAADTSATSFTANSFDIMRTMIEGDTTRYAVVTSFYHVPRVIAQLVVARLPFAVYPAEAFLLVEDSTRIEWLLNEFGDGAFAQRVIDEIKGIAAVLNGTYESRSVPLR